MGFSHIFQWGEILNEKITLPQLSGAGNFSAGKAVILLPGLRREQTMFFVLLSFSRVL